MRTLEYLLASVDMLGSVAVWTCWAVWASMDMLGRAGKREMGSLQIYAEKLGIPTDFHTSRAFIAIRL